MGRPASSQGDEQGPAVEAVARGWAEVGGQHDDERELGRLRRLELEGPDGEPGLGALDVGAHHQHTGQEAQGDHVEQRRATSRSRR